MRRSSRILTLVVPVAMAAVGVIAFASEARSPKASPAESSPAKGMAAMAAATNALPTPAPGSPSPGAARLARAKLGDGDAGVTRLVLELDRVAEHLTVELIDRPGIAVRVLDTAADPLPASITPGDGRVERISFVPEGSDLVVRIESVQAIRCRSFALHDPPRIVLDFDAAGALADTSKIAPVHSILDEGAAVAPEATDAAGETDHAGVEEHAGADEPRFDELLNWIEEFRREAQAVNASDSPEEKAAHSRTLAHLLAERGLFDEADRTLTQALASGVDTTHAYEDSLRLAEIRIRAGRSKDALPLARRLSPFGRSTEERLRLARILSDAGAPVAARAVLEEVMSRVPAEERSEARLLLARCLWDSGLAERSLGELETLSREPAIPHVVDGEATVLRADCLFALGRLAEARTQYERAARFGPGPEESAWIRLQLGHVAHREGRYDEALSLYKEALERWPDTFYATQAAWFLQTAERLGSAWAKKGGQGRG